MSRIDHVKFMNSWASIISNCRTSVMLEMRATLGSEWLWDVAYALCLESAYDAGGAFVFDADFFSAQVVLLAKANPKLYGQLNRTAPTCVCSQIWKHTQNFYEVDPDHWRQLCSPSKTAKIPPRALTNIRHANPFLVFPQPFRALHPGEIDMDVDFIGAFINGSSLSEDIIVKGDILSTTVVDAPGLLITLVGIHEYIHMGYTVYTAFSRSYEINCSSPEPMTFRDLIDSARYSSCFFTTTDVNNASFAESGYELDMHNEDELKSSVLPAILGLLLYNNTGNADIQKVANPTSGKKAKGRKAAARAKTTTYKIGTASGNSYRKAQAERPDSGPREPGAAGKRRSPAVYWKNGHTHYYAAPKSGTYHPEKGKIMVSHWHDGRYCSTGVAQDRPTFRKIK